MLMNFERNLSVTIMRVFDFVYDTVNKGVRNNELIVQ